MSVLRRHLGLVFMLTSEHFYVIERIVLFYSVFERSWRRRRLVKNKGSLLFEVDCYPGACEAALCRDKPSGSEGRREG